MKDKKPHISIVIPVFNEAKLLPFCLEAVFKQEFNRPYEVIVVDNNSTDNSVKIAGRFGVTIIKEKKQGTAWARNAGFKIAGGEIIIKLDADTIVYNSWLKDIAGFFQSHPDAIAVTAPVEFFTSSPLPKFIRPYSNHFAVKINSFLLGHHQLCGAAYAILKKGLKAIAKTNSANNICEDVDLSCHLANLGKIYLEPKLKVLSSYRRYQKNPIKNSLLSRHRFLNTLYLNHIKYKVHRQRWASSTKRKTK